MIKNINLNDKDFINLKDKYEKLDKNVLSLKIKLQDLNKDKNKLESNLKLKWSIIEKLKIDNIKHEKIETNLKEQIKNIESKFDNFFKNKTNQDLVDKYEETLKIKIKNEDTINNLENKILKLKEENIKNSTIIKSKIKDYEKRNIIIEYENNKKLIENYDKNIINQQDKIKKLENECIIKEKDIKKLKIIERENKKYILDLENKVNNNDKIVSKLNEDNNKISKENNKLNNENLVHFDNKDIQMKIENKKYEELKNKLYSLNENINNLSKTNIEENKVLKNQLIKKQKENNELININTQLKENNDLLYENLNINKNKKIDNLANISISPIPFNNKKNKRLEMVVNEASKKFISKNYGKYNSTEIKKLKNYLFN